jgi:hypothetical protein
MRRFLPHLVWAVGLVVLVIAFFVGPGVPYQDPTPEMRALEARQIQLFDRLAMIGFLLVEMGVLWIAARWFTRRISGETVQ